MLNKYGLLFTLTMYLFSAKAFALTDCTIIVYDNVVGEAVSFVLIPVNSDAPTLESNSRGVLFIDEGFQSEFSRVLFQLDFTSDLARKIYVRKLLRDGEQVPEVNSRYSGYYLKELCKFRKNEFSVPDLERGRMTY